MDNIIKITVKHNQRQALLSNDRESFWMPFIDTYYEYVKQFKENYEPTPPSIESIELAIKKNFGDKISNSLIEFCSKGLAIVDRRNYRELERRGLREKEYASDYETTLYKNEPLFRKAVRKSLLASQIVTKVIDISYGSLSIGVLFEPIDKFLDIFDNNFDLMRIFFEAYIPSAFLQTISGHTYPGKYNEMPLSFDYDLPENLKIQQALSQFPLSKVYTNDNNNSNKIDRTKWLTGLVTSPMLFPFILALLILFVAYQKLDTANSIYLEQNKVIQQHKEEIIKGYKDLFEEYKNSIKKDTTRTKTK